MGVSARISNMLRLVICSLVLSLAAGKQETEDALLKRLRPIYDMAPVNSTDVLGLMGIPLDQILRAVAVEIKVYSNAYRLMPKDDPAMEAGKSHAQSFLLEKWAWFEQTLLGQETEMIKLGMVPSSVEADVKAPRPANLTAAVAPSPSPTAYVGSALMAEDRQQHA